MWAGHLVRGWWLGREGHEELCRAGTVGVNGKVQDIAGADLGEAEPNEAEEVSGGRAELWMWRDVGGRQQSLLLARCCVLVWRRGAGAGMLSGKELGGDVSVCIWLLWGCVLVFVTPSTLWVHPLALGSLLVS